MAGRLLRPAAPSGASACRLLLLPLLLAPAGAAAQAAVSGSPAFFRPRGLATPSRTRVGGDAPTLRAEIIGVPFPTISLAIYNFQP